VLRLLQGFKESTAGFDENPLAGFKEIVSLLGEDCEPNQLKALQMSFDFGRGLE
jgi:hypothetical protein